MEIQYIKGDATAPIGDGNKIIVHVCNDIGGWGRGFVLAISKRWEAPEKAYRAWAASGERFSLGEVQFVQVEQGIWIANMIGQRDVKKDKSGEPPVRYPAIKDGLIKVGIYAKQVQATVHMPRIGCGLAGGTWDQVEPLINDALTGKGVKTVVYDFE
jgi:O-acetyl-ADP-ribose deacetylase (regulator of RNase III)